MLTSKQRSFLRGLSNKAEPIINIGKGGITPEITEALNNALEARELVKITVLSNCMSDMNEIVDALSARTHSEVVQVIGKKAVFYRESKKKKTIELPKA